MAMKFIVLTITQCGLLHGVLIFSAAMVYVAAHTKHSVSSAEQKHGDLQRWEAIVLSHLCITETGNFIKLPILYNFRYIRETRRDYMSHIHNWMKI